MRYKSSKKGFTLAELLIVVAIIAVLVAISIPIFTSQLKKARRATDQANVRSAKAAAAAEYMNDGETGPVSYIYTGGKPVKIDSSNVSSIIQSSKGYGKTEGDDNKLEKDGTYPTGASGTPKNNYVEVTVDDTQASQITAHWVSSASGAMISATGVYTFTGRDLNRDNITSELKSLGVSPDEVTTFKAGAGSTINETAEKGDGNQMKNGVLVNTFQQFPNLKSIDLSEAKLSAGNINLFQNLPASVEKITLPKSGGDYDIRGIWYYGGGKKVDSAIQNSGGDPNKDSRITAGHNGATIYRSQEQAIAAGNNSSK